MQALYYLKWPFLICFIGLLCNVIGALLKLRHWPGAAETLLPGSIIEAAAIAFAIVKIAFLKRPE